MVNRKIASGIKARDELVKGADFLANAVVSTLGPFGQNFFLDKQSKITNDGVSVAREIQISHDTEMVDGRPGNEINNRGAAALREAAIKTNDIAGDGTTTAILLAQAIYKTLSKYLSKENVVGAKKPTELLRQVEKERLEINEKLLAMATPIETKEQLIDSATVSVEDPDLGKVIGEAQWELGRDGFLLAEETAERFSSVEKVKGLRIDNGFATSAIVNNTEKWSLEVEQAGIILTSFTMKGMAEWTPMMKILEACAKAAQSQLIVVARAWTDETVNYCLQNIQKGSVKIYPISAPYVDMAERMKDLAAITGAHFYDSDTSSLDDIMISGMGKVAKVVAKRMEATITGVSNDKTDERVAKRIEELEKQRDGSQSEFEKKALSERIAQLQNGFAIVRVGSPSDMERKRLFDKCEDAVNAVRAAFQEGTVPGAGLAFKTIAEGLPDDYLLKRPLMTLHEQIMATAPTDFVIEDWVRDPVKVLRVALEQACVAASSFATAGGVVTAALPRPLDQLLGRAVHNPEGE